MTFIVTKNAVLTLSQLGAYEVHILCLGHNLCSNHPIFIKPSMYPSCLMSLEAIYQIITSITHFLFMTFFAKYAYCVHKAQISCLGHYICSNHLIFTKPSMHPSQFMS
jgi:hypothetical protein